MSGKELLALGAPMILVPERENCSLLYVREADRESDLFAEPKIGQAWDAGAPSLVYDDMVEAQSWQYKEK